MGISSFGLLIIGLLFVLSGTTFALQGLGIVGPPSSFMYSNSSWIYYGSILSVIGAALMAVAYRFRGSKADTARKSTPDEKVKDSEKSNSDKPTQ